MKDNKINKQKGSIILYALILMLVLSVIVTLIASIVLINIRSTSNSSKAISAFYAAETGLERSLQSIKANRDSQAVSLTSTLSTINGWGAATLATANSQYLVDSNNTETTSINFNLPIGSSKQIDLFDPDTGAAVISGSLAIVNMTWEPGANCISSSSCTATSADLEYSYKKFQSTTWGTATSGEDYQTSKITCATASCSSTTLSLTPSFGYQLKFKPICCDLNNVTIRVNNGSDINFKNYLIIESTGSYGNSSIKLRANTIWKPPLSGLGEYVLFSEESISK